MLSLAMLPRLNCACFVPLMVLALSLRHDTTSSLFDRFALYHSQAILSCRKIMFVLHLGYATLSQVAKPTLQQ